MITLRYKESKDAIPDSFHSLSYLIIWFYFKVSCWSLVIYLMLYMAFSQKTICAWREHKKSILVAWHQMITRKSNLPYLNGKWMNGYTSTKGVHYYKVRLDIQEWSYLIIVIIINFEDNLIPGRCKV